MANSYFQFKQFTIYHSKCAMKVGTDGVLIGAWAALSEGTEVSRVLDIGCGTGLVAIMAAQRASSSIIDGVDIDNSAVEQARDNANQSKWGDRITFHHTDIGDFDPNYKYDFIISNPPYFIDSLKAPSEQRTVARHTDTLDLEVLAATVDRLLSDDGVFSVIYPYVEANLFTIYAANHSLFCNKRVEIKGSPTTKIKRVMMQFSRDKKDCLCEELVIENGERHKYTEKYMELTKDFYLKF